MVSFEDIKKYGSFMLIILSLVAIIVSGIGFGIVYFIMDGIQTNFQSVNCVINDNTLVSTCQELWSLGLYPLLNMKAILIWGHTFFIFGMVMGMLFLGYRSGRSPFLLGIMVLLTMLLTYIGIEASNIYRTFLENDLFRDMMVEFIFYNRIMLNFPWFVFIVSFAAAMLGVVNYQRTKINKVQAAEELNF